MSNLVNQLEKKQLRSLPKFEIGSTVRVMYKIKEGDKERTQPFEGVVIARHHSDKSLKATFTVRKVSQGFGIERIFALHSPRIENILVVRQGRIRRAKLYYLRDRFGKAARIKEKLTRQVAKKLG
ncbi:MAG: 50S ribosomal protein L19 [Deltaproteobacteria bacterium]|nr:50S ribosomal protein L19 [Deltaproteobacteria bacterium]